MKSFVILGLLILSSLVSAADDWKVIAETENCPEKAQVLGKEGEKYVIVKSGETTQKLFAQDDSAFTINSKKNLQFMASEKVSGKPAYTFTQPSMVEANPPKLDIFNGGKKSHCRMSAK